MKESKTRDGGTTSTKDTEEKESAAAERARRAAGRVKSAQELVEEAKRAEREAKGGGPVVELTEPRHVDDPNADRAT